MRKQRRRRLPGESLRARGRIDVAWLREAGKQIDRGGANVRTDGTVIEALRMPQRAG